MVRGSAARSVCGMHNMCIVDSLVSWQSCSVSSCVCVRVSFRVACSVAEVASDVVPWERAARCFAWRSSNSIASQPVPVV